MKSTTRSYFQGILAIGGSLALCPAGAQAAVVTSVDQILVNSSNVTTAGTNSNPSRTNFGGASGIGIIGNLFSVSTTQQAGSLGFVDLLNTATASNGGSLGTGSAPARPSSGNSGPSTLTANGGGASAGGTWQNSGDGLLTSHTVTLVEWNSATPANSTVLASVTVAAGTGGSYYFNGFRWVDLVTAVTLNSSKTYAVLTNVFLQPNGVLTEGASLTHDAWVTNPGVQNGTTINYVLGDDFGTSINSTAGNPTSGLFLNNTSLLPTSGTLGVTPSTIGNLVYGAANVALIPEPSAALLGALGLLGLLRRRR